MLSSNGDPDPCHGYKLRYINPATGGPPMPTIGTFLALLPGGFTTAPYRSTDGTVYSVVEGTGETFIGDTAIRWKPRDLFIVPSWQQHRHCAASDAVLFSSRIGPRRRRCRCGERSAQLCSDWMRSPLLISSFKVTADFCSLSRRGG